MNQILSQGLLRVIFAIPFAVFGVMHLMAADKMQGMVPSYVPGGVIWVYITGVLLILGAAGFIINRSVRIAAYLLGALMLIFILTIHLPVVMGGDQNGMGSLLKDLSMMASALYIGGSSPK
jgi:putative oxidoreductase